MSVYKKALEKFGEQHQKIKAVEELAELSVEILKSINGKARKNIESEIADADIVLKQLKIMYPKWREAWKFKFARLAKIVES